MKGEYEERVSKQMAWLAGYFRLAKKKRDGWKGMEPDPSWELGR